MADIVNKKNPHFPFLCLQFFFFPELYRTIMSE